MARYPKTGFAQIQLAPSKSQEDFLNYEKNKAEEKQQIQPSLQQKTKK
jgi:hypothetical protein